MIMTKAATMPSFFMPSPWNSVYAGPPRNPPFSLGTL